MRTERAAETRRVALIGMSGHFVDGARGSETRDGLACGETDDADCGRANGGGDGGGWGVAAGRA